MIQLLSLAVGLAWLATAAATPSISTTDTEEAVESIDRLASPASEARDDRFYIAPFGTFIQPGGDRNAQSGWGAGMGFGKILDESFNIEVRGFWQHMQSNGYPNYKPAYETLRWDHGSMNLIGGAIDLQYYFTRETFSPYAVFSMGGMNTSYLGSLDWPPFDNDSRGTNISFVFETGLGATYELADNFLLRGDVRYRGDTAPSNFRGSDVSVLNDLLVNVGFVVPLGDKPAAGAAPIIAADGCQTRDTDADGVTDCDDRCPGGASRAKVDEQGCPVVMELRGVNFRYDSAMLTEPARQILDGVAEELVAMSVKKDLEVAGYASHEGKPGKTAYNLRLSQQRSQTVADYLRARGVSNALYAKGYGTEYPVASNATEEGRLRNRRVELRWMGD